MSSARVGPTAAETTEGTASAPTPSVPRAITPREVCNDQGSPARIAACIKRMCDNEPRFQNFPVCQRVRRQEEKQETAE